MLKTNYPSFISLFNKTCQLIQQEEDKSKRGLLLSRDFTRIVMRFSLYMALSVGILQRIVPLIQQVERESK